MDILGKYKRWIELGFMSVIWMQVGNALTIKKTQREL